MEILFTFKGEYSIITKESGIIMEKELVEKRKFKKKSAITVIAHLLWLLFRPDILFIEFLAKMLIMKMERL